jgi:hypothetical protein
MKHEITERLIKHYEDCVQELKEKYTDCDPLDLKIYLIRNSISTGICRCASTKFNYHDFYNFFKFLKGEYIYGVPIENIKSLDRVIECLQFRIDYLKNMKEQEILKAFEKI